MEYFEEAYTSENWIVRIFKRKPRQNREGLRFISKNMASFPNNAEEIKNSSKAFENYKYKNKIILKKKRKIATIDNLDK